VTVAPPLSRLHLVPALVGTALLCVALAWPAVAKPPAGKGPRAHTPPGQAKKAARSKAKSAPPGQAKRSAPPPGQAKQSAPAARTAAAPGQAKKSSPPPGQAKKIAAPAPQSTAPGQAKQRTAAPAPSAQARRRAAARRAARARAAAASRRAAAVRRQSAAATRASRTARTAVPAAAAAGAAAATEASQPEEQQGNGKPAKERDATPSWPLTRQDDLPQPLRVVRDVVEVVPTPLRILVAGLVALSILLGLASGLTLLRNRRLARQRRELLGQVGLLQAALLPGMPDKLGTARASVAYRPADGPGAGGDFYDVFPLAAGRTAVLIGDVSGHGRAALGRTALSRYTLRAYVEAGLEPREALQIAGSVLAGKLQGDFVTAMVAIHDAGAGTLTYSTAGHPPPIVISGAGFVPVLAATAPPLGVGAGTGQRQTTLPFPRGAVACFYTDGLTEARTRDGQLGAERLEEIVRELGPGVTAKQVIDSVASSAGTITDDAAVCVLAAEEGLAVVRSRVERLELSRAELRGPMLAGFLDSCGVPHRQARAAERDARALAREHGGAILEVRMGDVAQVDVRPPELPVRDDVMASLHQP
jgi:serine phosphatase RsbU (regulator of sigma subunit)